ncbi:hypothetical protein D7X88_17335 [bacterium C-53]|nr:hypothetical protein [Lachnospiraceae bacterium]NBI04715.1 hypothetical protein [Lachnospiraceae bacterium]RKJ07861.1 hypothetical protein D7X88_17335 [bacterium C-53]
MDERKFLSQIPRSKLTGHQNSSAASYGVFAPRGSRQISMQVWLLGSLLRGNKKIGGKTYEKNCSFITYSFDDRIHYGMCREQ